MSSLIIAILVLFGASILFSILSFLSPIIFLVLSLIFVLAIIRTVKQSREIHREAEEEIRKTWQGQTKEANQQQQDVIDAEYTEEDLD